MPGATPDQMGSDEARASFAEMLDEVQHHGRHITVMRYRKPAAVIVPREWYEQAKGLLGNGKQS
jgi:prevent-host-death family protein